MLWLLGACAMCQAFPDEEQLSTFLVSMKDLEPYAAVHGKCPGSTSRPQALADIFMSFALTCHCVMPRLQADPQTGFQTWMQQHGRSYSEEEQARFLHCLTPFLRH